MHQVVIDSDQGVGLAAAEGGLDLDPRRSLSGGQLGVDATQQAAVIPTIDHNTTPLFL